MPFFTFPKTWNQSFGWILNEFYCLPTTECTVWLDIQWIWSLSNRSKHFWARVPSARPKIITTYHDLLCKPGGGTRVRMLGRKLLESSGCESLSKVGRETRQVGCDQIHWTSTQCSIKRLMSSFGERWKGICTHICLWISYLIEYMPK